MKAKLPSPRTLKIGFINLFKILPRQYVKLVWESNSVATKNGNKDGTIEFAHKTSPFFAADKLVLENITRQAVNTVNITGNKSCFNLNI